MVKKGQPVIAWDKAALTSLQKAFEYIKQDSPQNALKVRDSILKIVRSLPNHPLKFPPDKFKNNNTGSYRAFEKYSLRVAYRVSSKEIKILRIRHVKQEPKSY